MVIYYIAQVASPLAIEYIFREAGEGHHRLRTQCEQWTGRGGVWWDQGIEVGLYHKCWRMKGIGVANTSQEVSEASTGKEATNIPVGSCFKAQKPETNESLGRLKGCHLEFLFWILLSEAWCRGLIRVFFIASEIFLLPAGDISNCSCNKDWILIGLY